MECYGIHKKSDPCERIAKPQKWDKMPLTRNLASQQFEKWGIDFVGPISLATKTTQARYIIVAINYFTKWAEARATRKADARLIVSAATILLHTGTIRHARP